MLGNKDDLYDVQEDFDEDDVHNDGDEVIVVDSDGEYPLYFMQI